MKQAILVLASAAALLGTGAIAQSTGEAGYEEQCGQQASKASPSERAATRETCVNDARRAAKLGGPGDQPGTDAKRGTTKADRAAAREQRREVGREAAREPKQDPKRPDQ